MSEDKCLVCGKYCMTACRDNAQIWDSKVEIPPMNQLIQDVDEAWEREMEKREEEDRKILQLKARIAAARTIIAIEQAAADRAQYEINCILSKR